jgi:hypothetical protein
VNRIETINRRESADDYYRIVTQLNDGWRVIECTDGIQWILQRRGSPERTRKDDWRGCSYCQTSEALRRCTRERAGNIGSAAAGILAALPARIEAS